MKIVYGTYYFATEALPETPRDIQILCTPYIRSDSEAFNFIKVDPRTKSVTFLCYSDLYRSPHPYLRYSTRYIPGAKEPQTRIESKDNPVILHRMELMLHSQNPYIEELKRITANEEAAGMYSKLHIRKIGRLQYWNNLCHEKHMYNSIVKLDDGNSTTFDRNL